MLVLERLSDAQRRGIRCWRWSAERGQSGRCLQRPGGAERAVAAAGDPGGAGQRAIGNRRTWTWSRPMAREPRWAIRSRRRRFWPPTGRNGLPDRPLWLGSIKSNMGHTSAAAGVGGVIKMVQAMRHGVMPQTLHVDVPTPHVDWAAGAVSLLTEPQPWPELNRPRRAGVSSFGISGTNAHVILEQAPVPDSALEPLVAKGVAEGTTQHGAIPWVLSARGAEALAGQAERLLAHVGAHPDLGAADVGWSLASARSTFEHRAVVVGADREHLMSGLAGLVAGDPGPGVVVGRARPVGKTVFVFPGQGSQWVGMGAELLNTSKVFADHMQRCDKALSEHVAWSLIDVIRGSRGCAGPGSGGCCAARPVGGDGVDLPNCGARRA